MSFRLPAGVRALSRARAARGAVPRRLFGLHLRDDRRDADHAPRAARHHQERGHRLRAHLPRLQLQVPVGAARRQRPPAADRPLRAAAQLAVAGRRAGDGSRSRFSAWPIRRTRSTWSRSRRSRSASPARPSTSSSTPIASSCSSRASSAPAPACRSTAGASAPRPPARSRWCSPRASAGPPRISACAAFALPAMLVGVVMGEPARHREPAKPHGVVEAVVAYFSPLRGIPASARARWWCCFSC